MASIFSRFTDIISSNINAMLDKAENPSKMVKLIIAEMEDTLVELKAACASAMADQSKSKRRIAEIEKRRDLWLNRAEAAALKNRDDLAKEALIEKRSVEDLLDSLQAQGADLAVVVDKYRLEIEQLEVKLNQAREKEQLMAHRGKQAQNSIKASGQMKRYDLSEHKIKLDRLDNRLDKMEAEAELEFNGRQMPSVQDDERERAFAELDDSLDLELDELKKRLSENKNQV